MDYSKAVRVIRAAKGLNQSEFADKIAKTPSLVSRLEAGERNPSSALIEKICAEFSIPAPLFMLLASHNVGDLNKKDVSEMSQELLGLIVKGAH